MTKVLAINAGSSSLKFQLLAMPSEEVLTVGLVERIGLTDGVFKIEFKDEEVKKTLDIPNHTKAVELLMDALLENKIVESFDEIAGVGHRVVHGGEKFGSSVVVTPEVLADIEALSDLAPLHNPANMTGIKAFVEKLPNAISVAVFDTAFHQTMPATSYLYPIKHDLYKKHAIRKYGFHGTSHQFVSERAIALLGLPADKTRIITVHIGNGGSLTAVKGGKSIDTSMGFTPLAGIMMGTRSGDVDPAVVPYIMEKEGIDVNQAVDLLNKQSGLVGVSELSSDMRDITSGVEAGNVGAKLAFDLFIKRITDYIGSYLMTLGGADAIVFTAGIGENAGVVRKAILEKLAFLGVEINEEANNTRGQELLVSTADSKIKAFVIPTNEEIMIARDTFSFLTST
ncbi:MAG: acetate kinase [Defluviitaleaceae bacterium]|nr:acetate kinase [Defluviitaleaceae bacterium]